MKEKESERKEASERGVKSAGCKFQLGDLLVTQKCDKSAYSIFPLLQIVLIGGWGAGKCYRRSTTLNESGDIRTCPRSMASCNIII